MFDESLLTVALVAVGLAMDCFAVSVTRGTVIKEKRLATGAAMAVFFGGFQGGMTALGFFSGKGFVDYVAAFDHWIAFGLLAYVGGRMVLESRKKDDAEQSASLGLGLLLVLSVATSIDALAVGLGFAFVDVEIVSASLVIGLASFFLSIGGFFLGGKAKDALGSRAEFLGGLVLIGIGFKVLFEHLAA